MGTKTIHAETLFVVVEGKLIGTFDDEEEARASRHGKETCMITIEDMGVYAETDVTVEVKK